MTACPNIVDLFCGCGGLSLGAQSAGLTSTLAFDIDPILTSSFEYNHPKTRLILKDLATVDGADIRRELGPNIDGIFGGPPCQGFSSIGQRRTDDPRRSLLGHFFRLVGELKPAFFVMENVKGLGYADSIPTLNNALNFVPGNYKILGPNILDAADFGAPTRRPRLFVIGIDPSRCDNISNADFETAKKKPATVRAAISDLLSATEIDNDSDFDLWKIRQRGNPSKYAAKLRNRTNTFSGHKKTSHTSDVVKRFKKVKQGEIEAIGRHPRLSWDGQCPTLRAGTGSDHGSFQSVRPIHPEEHRVITVREAARIQGFPDDFRFHPTIWHSFRMIGNSVSPVIAKELFSLIKLKFVKEDVKTR